MVKDQNKRKPKKFKDPNRPKRAMSAFFIFQNEARPKLKEQRPDLKATEIVKHLSASWNSMTDEQKKPFQALYEEDKLRWMRENADYVPPPQMHTSTGRRRKDPNEPKKALTAFIFFSNHMRPSIKDEFPEMRIPEIGKRLGVMWKGMDEEARQPFKLLENQDKVRHAREKSEYQERKREAEEQTVEHEQEQVHNIPAHEYMHQY